MSSFTLSISCRKDNLSVKYGSKSNSSPRLGSTSIRQLATVPTLLTPAAEKLISLPLELYNLEVRDVWSMAVLERPDYRGVKYLAPLTGALVMNHIDPIFCSEDMVSCKLDDCTIVTFQLPQDQEA